jgi:hypothetical protein
MKPSETISKEVYKYQGFLAELCHLTSLYSRINISKLLKKHGFKDKIVFDTLIKKKVVKRSKNTFRGYYDWYGDFPNYRFAKSIYLEVNKPKEVPSSFFKNSSFIKEETPAEKLFECYHQLITLSVLLKTKTKTDLNTLCRMIGLGEYGYFVVTNILEIIKYIKTENDPQDGGYLWVVEKPNYIMVRKVLLCINLMEKENGLKYIFTDRKFIYKLKLFLNGYFDGILKTEKNQPNILKTDSYRFKTNHKKTNHKINATTEMLNGYFLDLKPTIKKPSLLKRLINRILNQKK